MSSTNGKRTAPNDGRLPWEIIETFPSTDTGLLATWERAVETADTAARQVRARIGRGLALYWATQEAVLDESWVDVERRRIADLDGALAAARELSEPTIHAEAVLGKLYGTWGPDHHLDREPLLDELAVLRPLIADEEVLLRAIEWEVLRHLDVGELDAARRSITTFTDAAAGTELILFKRREVLWRGCLAMLEGAIDESLQINQDAISSTANVAGSPFSFQNVAITLAIERYLRRGLGDVVDAIRSIRASSPRVGANWETGLAFALSEMGEIDEATELFRSLSADGFARVPRDLNWLVTMQLLGLIALTIDAEDKGRSMIPLLRPFAHLDGTHGSGYASYGPVGRVVGSLMARWGDAEESERVFEHVLSTRTQGPWWALTWYDRAREQRDRRPVDALADARRAERELGDRGLTEWAAVARELADELALEGHGGPVALRDGGTWTLRHRTGSATVTASVGLDHLLWLLARPGTVVDVADLDPLVDGSLPQVAAVDSTLDAAARRQYRQRLDELDARPALTADDESEAAFLRRELSGATHVTSTSAELERLRVRVTKAIRRALNHIAQCSPSLGAHLREAVTTGRSCSYQPADGEAWSITRR